jgi:hypothetical protein
MIINAERSISDLSAMLACSLAAPSKNVFAVDVSPVTKLGPFRRQSYFASQSPQGINVNRPEPPAAEFFIKVACFVCDLYPIKK